MDDLNKISKKLFRMDSAGACGVIMTEDVMKKVLKLQAKYVQSLKELLSCHTDNLIAYDWTMAYNTDRAGTAFYGYYKSPFQSPDDRIKNFNIVKPEKIECYDTQDRELVSALIDSMYEGQFKEQKRGPAR